MEKILILSQEDVNVLHGGFKFTPTRLPDKIELTKNVQQLSRRLRFLELLYTENQSEEEKSSDDSIIKSKSAFKPPRNRDKILDQNTDLLNSLNIPDLQKAPKCNFLKLDAATKNLKNGKNVEIKEADKGGSVVILSKSYYKSTIPCRRFFYNFA